MPIFQRRLARVLAETAPDYRKITVTPATIDDGRIRTMRNKDSTATRYEVTDITTEDGRLLIWTTNYIDDAEVSVSVYTVSSADEDIAGYYYVITTGDELNVLRVVAGLRTGWLPDHYGPNSTQVDRRPAPDKDFKQNVLYARDDVPTELAQAITSKLMAYRWSMKYALFYDSAQVSGGGSDITIKMDNAIPLSPPDSGLLKTAATRQLTVYDGIYVVTGNNANPDSTVEALFIDGKVYKVVDEVYDAVFAERDRQFDQYLPTIAAYCTDWFTEQLSQFGQRQRRSSHYCLADIGSKYNRVTSGTIFTANIIDTEVRVDVASCDLACDIQIGHGGWTTADLNCQVNVSYDLLAYAGDRELDRENADGFVTAILQLCDHVIDHLEDNAGIDLSKCELDVAIAVTDHGEHSIVDVDPDSNFDGNQYTSVVDALDRQCRRYGSIWHYDYDNDYNFQAGDDDID